MMDEEKLLWRIDVAEKRIIISLYEIAYWIAQIDLELEYVNDAFKSILGEQPGE